MDREPRFEIAFLPCCTYQRDQFCGVAGGDGAGRGADPRVPRRGEAGPRALPRVPAHRPRLRRRGPALSMPPENGYFTPATPLRAVRILEVRAVQTCVANV